MNRCWSYNKVTHELARFLVLAVFLNLSGHLFFHLKDALLEPAAAHLSSHHETSSATTPQHQCSACQDSQSLSLVSTGQVISAAALTAPVIGRPQNFYQPVAVSTLYSPRAPPRR